MNRNWMIRTAAVLLAVMMLGSCAAAAGEESVGQKLSTYYNLAVGYIGRENYDKAMKYIDAALEICPEETNGDMYADLYLKKACVHTIRQEYEDALAELEESIRVRPEVAEAYLVRVQVYTETGEAGLAAENLEKYIELSGDTSLNETLAGMYVQLDEAQKAEESYSRLAESVTEDPDLVPYNLAMYEMGAGMYAEALVNLQACKGDPEKYPGLHYNTGICLMLTERYAEAAEAFTASIASEDFVQDAYYNRAVCMMSLSEYESAIDDFTVYIDGLKAEASAETPEEPAADEKPEIPEIGAEGQPEETAEEPGTEAPAAEQTEPAGTDPAYYYRGVCFIAVKKYEEAAADFTVCIEGGLNVNESCFNRGVSLLQTGDFKGAEADFTASIDSGYLVDDALFYRAYAFQYQENYEAALADLTRCVEDGYNLGQTYQQRAAVYQALGDEDSYLADLEASLDYLED